MNKKQDARVAEALEILRAIGMPRAQLNNRSAYCLLALLGLNSKEPWKNARSPLAGITPIMDFSREKYSAEYAPNSRESFRRFTIHQFLQAGLATYNPDDPKRSVNSPKSVYQISPQLLELVRSFGTVSWSSALAKYLETNVPLAAKYAAERKMNVIPVLIKPGTTISLSPGDHSLLIKAIIELFGPQFVPGGILIYAGDTGDKWGYFDKALASKVGITVDKHGKMPDVIIFYPEKNWLILIESVTSHGPMDAKRHEELSEMFRSAKAGIVYVTAFPSRKMMTKYLATIAWETEVWVAEAPSHLIHFNGTRFLGPYKK
jgi:hypothetical protein